MFGIVGCQEGPQLSVNFEQARVKVKRMLVLTIGFLTNMEQLNLLIEHEVAAIEVISRHHRCVLCRLVQIATHVPLIATHGLVIEYFLLFKCIFNGVPTSFFVAAAILICSCRGKSKFRLVLAQGKLSFQEHVDLLGHELCLDLFLLVGLLLLGFSVTWLDVVAKLGLPNALLDDVAQAHHPVVTLYLGRHPEHFNIVPSRDGERVHAFWVYFDALAINLEVFLALGDLEGHVDHAVLSQFDSRDHIAFLVDLAEYLGEGI